MQRENSEASFHQASCPDRQSSANVRIFFTWWPGIGHLASCDYLGMEDSGPVCVPTIPSSDWWLMKQKTLLAWASQRLIRWRQSWRRIQLIWNTYWNFEKAKLSWTFSPENSGLEVRKERREWGKKLREVRGQLVRCHSFWSWHFFLS